VWGALAERNKDLLKTGAPVYLEGSLQNNEYMKNGEKRYEMRLQAYKLQSLARSQAVSPEQGMSR
jgi:single-stranded DNA-binding protein